MSLELWIPFVLASTVILIIPGPTIILVVSQAVTHGRRSVIPLVAGVLLGDFTAMTLSLLGLGAILSTSAALFFFVQVDRRALSDLPGDQAVALGALGPFGCAQGQPHVQPIAISQLFHRDGPQSQEHRLFCGLSAPVCRSARARTDATRAVRGHLPLLGNDQCRALCAVCRSAERISEKEPSRQMVQSLRR